VRTLEDVIDFVRGRRERPPPGPKHPLAMILLVLASLLHLPIVYLLVALNEAMPTVTLFVGLLSIGLAWCGGVSLEGRRPGTVRVVAAFGVAEGALAFAPSLASALGDARWLFVAIAILASLAVLATSSVTPESVSD